MVKAFTEAEATKLLADLLLEPMKSRADWFTKTSYSATVYVDNNGPQVEAALLALGYKKERARMVKILDGMPCPTSPYAGERYNIIAARHPTENYCVLEILRA